MKEFVYLVGGVKKKKKLIGVVEKKISQKFAGGRKRFPKINGAVFWE